MNRDDFEAFYARNSGTSVAQLHEMGLYGTPCDCGDEMCEGWAIDWERGDVMRAYAWLRAWVGWALS